MFLDSTYFPPIFRSFSTYFTFFGDLEYPLSKQDNLEAGFEENVDQFTNLLS